MYTLNVYIGSKPLFYKAEGEDVTLCDHDKRMSK